MCSSLGLQCQGQICDVDDDDNDDDNDDNFLMRKQKFPAAKYYPSGLLQIILLKLLIMNPSEASHNTYQLLRLELLPRTSQIVATAGGAPYIRAMVRRHALARAKNSS